MTCWSSVSLPRNNLVLSPVVTNKLIYASKFMLIVRRASDRLIFCIQLCVNIRTFEAAPCDTYIVVCRTKLRILDSKTYSSFLGRFSVISWTKSELYLSTPVYFIYLCFILLGDWRSRLKLSHFECKFYTVWYIHEYFFIPLMKDSWKSTKET
jgi:hypothetical protein